MISTSALLLLATLLPQNDDPDLASPYRNEDHECAFRPPAGWRGRAEAPPEVVRFMTDDGELLLIHYFSPNPTPLAHFRELLDNYLKEKYPGHTSLLNRETSIDGRSAIQVALRAKGERSEEVVIYRTILHQSHLEYYIFDCKCVASAWDRWKPVFDKSMGTFRVCRRKPDLEERAGTARTLEALKGAGLGQEWLAGEAWQGVFLGQQKVGYQRQKLTPTKIDGAPGFSFESDTVLDFKSGGKNRTQVRGSFTADGRIQRLESEEIVTPEKSPELKFRFEATLEKGRVRVRREIRDLREEASFEVPNGTLFSDVADVFRRAVATGAKTTYFIPVLNPFEQETGEETIEVAGLDTVELEGRGKHSVHVVLSTVRRRKSLVYWYRQDGSLFIIQGAKQPFGVMAVPKEEALK